VEEEDNYQLGAQETVLEIPTDRSEDVVCIVLGVGVHQLCLQGVGRAPSLGRASPTAACSPPLSFSPFCSTSSLHLSCSTSRGFFLARVVYPRLFLVLVNRHCDRLSG
jgi:hypothetical protein